MVVQEEDKIRVYMSYYLCCSARLFTDVAEMCWSIVAVRVCLLQLEEFFWISNYSSKAKACMYLREDLGIFVWKGNLSVFACSYILFSFQGAPSLFVLPHRHFDILGYG